MVWRALGLAAADEPLQPLANRLIVFRRLCILLMQQGEAYERRNPYRPE
jgi:hypothetical protein